MVPAGDSQQLNFHNSNPPASPFRWLFATAVVVYMSIAVATSADCRVSGQAWILGEKDGNLAPSVDAKQGERIVAHLVVRGTLDGHPVEFSDGLEALRNAPRQYVSWTRAGCPAAKTAWSIIRARPSPRSSDPCGKHVYANAIPCGERYGDWRSVARLEYEIEEIGDQGFQLAITTPDRPYCDRMPMEHCGLGVARLAATFAVGSSIARTPTVEFRRAFVSDQVFRFTFRLGDDLIGWITSYYGVPYVFGSFGDGANAQAERYIGTDCADLLVAAFHRIGRLDLDYANVEQLFDLSDVLVPPASLRRDFTGFNSGSIRLYAGDLIMVKFGGAAATRRAWDHLLIVASGAKRETPLDYLGPETIVAGIGDERGLVFETLQDWIRKISRGGSILRTAVVRIREPGQD